MNQFPGLGMNDIVFGNKQNRIKGNESPKPIIIKIVKISNVVPAKANPTAVPTNGAVQGVANRVINIPVKKSPAKPLALYERTDKNFDGK
jgi:hypothetical protein|tara:strand:+ start:145 stop:414 length:270 start_codon:yes stop_codon:yes gene_type:complete